ncbi:toxin-antitoxin system, toxin component [Streptomyces sp. NPDC127038]|uniref:toxin-antitoxin system, toxin component n=1 Tax=Streptomyces sp. NPDC127038 TaxID=3347114 RepID=UPI00364EEDFE
MKALSTRLLRGLAEQDTNGDEIFTALGPLLSTMRGRPVFLMRTTFPPDTASGMWVDLPDMDILAVREDAADTDHAQVILGHEIWHMVQGHCTAHTSAGRAAARARSGQDEAIHQVVRHLLASGDGPISGRALSDLQYAARTDFDAEQEIEAEYFGLHFGTELRAFRRTRRRPDLHGVAGRIEDSLGRGPWTK